jgi:lipopolysaccharide/colanic/teichoic acid biosynthesis glycosyltransferase
MYRAFAKRAFDIVITMLALIPASPILLGLAVLIGARLGRPILFRQKRGGYRCRPFEVIKFRSMTKAIGPDGASLSDAERLTPFGRWLRENSLDELPGLWNVLRGQMSLVGPRPFIFDYMPLYSPTQRRRHEVRPGITGWAQVNGRNNLSWEERFALDVWYVDNYNFFLDLKILAMTVAKVFRREDINADGEATMPRFEG